MRRYKFRRTTSHGDRGAFLLIFALALVVILTMVAFAVDLGQARASQRANRSTVDLAALSAGYWLAGGEFTGTQPTADAIKACVSAVRSVQTNEPSFQPVEDVPSSCAAIPTCNPSAPPTTQPAPLTFTDSHMILQIQFPVLDGAVGGLADNRFSGASINDGDSPCDRMRITLKRTDDVAFAGVIGVTSLTTSGSVVVKGDIRDPLEEGIPAFFMLERTDCGSITTSVGTGDGIEVESTVTLKGDPQPGFMHSDSDATTDCSGNTQDAYAIYGGNSQTPESIILHSYTDSDGVVHDGIMESRAPETTGAGGYIRGTYRTGGLIGRQPVDDMYDASMKGIHSASDAALDRAGLLNTATAAADGYDVLDCTGNVIAEGADPDPDTKAFLICPTFDTDLTLDYTEVIFSGAIDLNNGRDLALPNATDITVAESVDISGGGSDQSVLDAPAARNVSIGGRVTVPNNGVLAVNRSGDHAAVTETPTCLARNADGTTSGLSARVVVFSNTTDPAMDVAGNLTLCDATLYLAGERTNSFDRLAIESGTDPSGGECSTSLPCPDPTAAPGARYYFAAGATVNLVGPNMTGTPAPSSGWPWTAGQSGGVEDLAFWTESGGLSDVRGGATMTILGVFAAPNGSLEFRSGPSSTDPIDAQFIARKLKMFNGRLNMLPTASNTVSVPLPGSFTLIR